MELSELLNTCAGSPRDDWNVIGQVGDRTHASYKPNLAIGLAWGIDEGATPFEEDWVPRSPAGKAGVRSTVDSTTTATSSTRSIT